MASATYPMVLTKGDKLITGNGSKFRSGEEIGYMIPFDDLFH